MIKTVKKREEVLKDRFLFETVKRECFLFIFY